MVDESMWTLSIQSCHRHSGSFCLHVGSSITSLDTSNRQSAHLCAALSNALLTFGAILKSELCWEDLGVSPGQGLWRLNVQTAGREEAGHFDPHPGPANRGAAATLTKCIPQSPGLNPCLTLTDKLFYG